MYFILIMIILFLTYYNYMLKKEVKKISNQIRKNKGEYVNLHTKAIDNSIEELVIEINKLYDESQKISARSKGIEEEIKKSIASMSHDLRTPLTSIIGYVQLLKDNKTLEEDKIEYINIIEKRTKSLEELITSFYDLSRLNTNEFKFNLTKVNLKSELSDSIATYYNEFVKQEIEPIIEIEDNIPNIISDKSAVRRIFSNLIGNILKHAKGDVKIYLKEENGEIFSVFVNNAPNLNEDNVKNIFNRFYTIDDSRNDRNTGLGLAIVKSLVEKLGNQVSAELKDDELIIIIKWKY
ncbi:MAG: sensor histidine kinase [Clostridium sp.]